MNMTSIITFKPFELGRIIATIGVLGRVSPERLPQCLARHAAGDWGHVCPEDAAENNLATHEGLRVLSAYPIDPSKPCKGHGENCLWIITEADRSVTTFLLPEEY